MNETRQGRTSATASRLGWAAVRWGVLVVLCAYVVIVFLPPTYGMIYKFTKWAPPGAEQLPLGDIVSMGWARVLAWYGAIAYYVLTILYLFDRRAEALQSLVVAIALDLGRWLYERFLAGPEGLAQTDLSLVLTVSCVFIAVLTLSATWLLRQRAVLV